MSSFSRELLLHVDRRGAESLAGQLKRQLRAAIRGGSLRAGLSLPSTRALAAELGISRPIVVDAYEQLAAEGYLQTRQGARTTVAELGQIARRRKGVSRTREVVCDAGAPVSNRRGVGQRAASQTRRVATTTP